MKIFREKIERKEVTVIVEEILECFFFLASFYKKVLYHMLLCCDYSKLFRYGRGEVLF